MINIHLNYNNIYIYYYNMLQFFKLLSVYFRKRKSVIRPFIKTKIIRKVMSFSRPKIRTARSVNSLMNTRTKIRQLSTLKEF